MRVTWAVLAGFVVVTAAPFLTADPPKPIVSRIHREPVESSAVATVGYSKRLHAFEIEFNNGAIYRYLDVPVEVYRAFLAADSKARFYDQNIRGHYRSVHVKPRSPDE